VLQLTDQSVINPIIRGPHAAPAGEGGVSSHSVH